MRIRKTGQKIHKTVLIVDDEDTAIWTVRDCIIGALGRPFFVFASDGLEALSAVKNTRFDLIITDNLMPKMGGIELVDKIREIDPKVKLVMFTGYKDSVPKSSEDKLDLLIEKPMVLDVVKYIKDKKLFEI